MGHQIVPEVFFFLASAVYGAILIICYDQLRVLRSLFSHSVSLVDAEDILFFLTAGVGFFGLLYMQNEGTMRWFAFLGCGLGAVLCRKTVSRALYYVECRLLTVLLYPIRTLAHFIKTGLQKWKKQIKMKKRLRKSARKQRNEQKRKKKTE